MNRIIRKVAVLGSGVMGSRIACHFANAGFQVRLLDIAPKELLPEEIAKNLALENNKVRNRIVQNALDQCLVSNPAPLYLKLFASRIEVGNFEDDFEKISDCDWIIEVVIERLDIKHSVFEKVDQFRKKGSIVSSNTSGIPIHLMLENRSDDFQQHFLGTHFFNPPRYLPLLELIPTSKTLPEILSFCENFGRKNLGKKTVICKDTPAFIANRIGVYSILSLFHLAKELQLSIEEIDELTGPILARPKSATFRTCDVVGIDTLALVAGGVKQACSNDEEKDIFEIPDFIQTLLDNKWLGSKTRKGFYEKIKGEDGSKQFLAFNIHTKQYEVSKRVKFPELEALKNIENAAERTKMLLNLPGKIGNFYQKMFGGLFAYVANRIPEISEDIYRIDDAIKAGFGWEIGVFQVWDIIGFEKGLNWIKSEGKTIAPWLEEMKKAGVSTFYSSENGSIKCFDRNTKKHEIIAGTESLISLDALRSTKTIWKSTDTTIVDLGDGILNVEFHTKMNTIGGGVLQGINKAIDLAEKEYKGLVISNTGNNFSAGANVGMIFMMAIEQDYDELNFAVKSFQDTMMRARYSSIPVVVAPHNLALGGACELSMHADRVVAHAELYMGLVEFGVGLIPGGGGTKEFAKRLSEEMFQGDIKMNKMRERFLTIGQAKVATSAHEAFELGYLRKGIDEIVFSRDEQLKRAKEVALQLAENGYVAPKKERNIQVLGQEGLGLVYVGANSMRSGNYMSDHDQVISEKLGFVLCGGDLSENTFVSEQYLLDLERKAFVELCKQRKTLERLESLVKKGKILRN